MEIVRGGMRARDGAGKCARIVKADPRHKRDRKKAAAAPGTQAGAEEAHGTLYAPEKSSTLTRSAGIPSELRVSFMASAIAGGPAM
jgi:hypothetical protein